MLEGSLAEQIHSEWDRIQILAGDQETRANEQMLIISYCNLTVAS